MAEVDTEREIQNLKEWASFRIQMQLPTDMEKVAQELAARAKIKDPEQYIPKQDPMAQQPMMIGDTPVEMPQAPQGAPMPPQPMPQI
jgi:hypothetical protein